MLQDTKVIRGRGKNNNIIIFFLNDIMVLDSSNIFMLGTTTIVQIFSNLSFTITICDMIWWFFSILVHF
jgi:hypothetical protein